jgi:hypothetical protein
MLPAQAQAWQVPVQAHQQAQVASKTHERGGGRVRACHQ